MLAIVLEIELRMVDIYILSNTIKTYLIGVHSQLQVLSYSIQNIEPVSLRRVTTWKLHKPHNLPSSTPVMVFSVTYTICEGPKLDA